jgi:hypothetical protein
MNRRAPATHQVWTTDQVGDVYSQIARAVLALAAIVALASWAERL